VFSLFYGAAALMSAEGVINLTDRTITGTQMVSGTSEAGIQLRNTGRARTYINGAYADIGNEWQNPVGSLPAADWEAAWQRVSGDAASVILGGMVQNTFYNLGTDRIMRISNPDADNVVSIVIDVSIRPAGSGGAATDIGRITLTAINTYL
jgi:hypothetical protein